MEISTLGIDLSKTSFHVIGLNGKGEIVLRRKFSRKQLIQFTANQQKMLIGMEACGGAHFLGRALRAQGHDARLMPAQFVKPFRKSNKNDYLDAEAIAEAVQRRTMRFVPIKTDDQLDLQALHRVRDRWVTRRTAVMNQIRGFLSRPGRSKPFGARTVADGALCADPSQCRRGSFGQQDGANGVGPLEQRNMLPRPNLDCRVTAGLEMPLRLEIRKQRGFPHFQPCDYDG